MLKDACSYFVKYFNENYSHLVLDIVKKHDMFLNDRTKNVFSDITICYIRKMFDIEIFHIALGEPVKYDSFIEKVVEQEMDLFIKGEELWFSLIYRLIQQLENFDYRNKSEFLKILCFIKKIITENEQKISEEATKNLLEIIGDDNTILSCIPLLLLASEVDAFYKEILKRLERCSAYYEEMFNPVNYNENNGENYMDKDFLDIFISFFNDLLAFEEQELIPVGNCHFISLINSVQSVYLFLMKKLVIKNYNEYDFRKIRKSLKEKLVKFGPEFQKKFGRRFRKIISAIK